MDTELSTKPQSIVLYYQDDRQAPGNPGWAYEITAADGQHDSGGLDVEEGDPGSADLADVSAAFRLLCPAEDALVRRWERMPEGGWRARL